MFKYNNSSELFAPIIHYFFTNVNTFSENNKKAPDFRSFLLINSPNLLNALDKAVERCLSRALLLGEAGRPAFVSDDRLPDVEADIHRVAVNPSEIE